jgi:hypothetical protein
MLVFIVTPTMPNSSIARPISATAASMWCRGKHLHVNAGAIHQSQPCVEFRAAAGSDAALCGRGGSAQVDEHVEIAVGPVVGAHVDPHVYQRYSLNATPMSV